MRGKYVEITELYILCSELSRRKLSPTLATAHYSSPDNTIGLVAQWELSGYESSWAEIFLLLPMFMSNIMHNPHKLNNDSNRNTKNIKIIKIAVVNANLCV